jgi:sugar (pentulose or hexulose) kinase
MKIEAVAVIDIGKTNKKVMVFDRDLTFLDKRTKNFESRIVDGVELEAIDEMREWILEGLADLSKRYEFVSVAITTHGAAVVTVTEDGEIACPVVSYTHQVEDDLHDRFYETVGARDDLQRETATVEIKPLVNVAKLLYFTRERWPDRFETVSSILFFPQYFAYILTGNLCSDFTYVGCHTYLWDFRAWDWSHVAETLGFTGMLPGPPRRSSESAGGVTEEIAERCGIAAGTPVTVGIHDSNASLLPYLLRRSEEPFVLNSTGTWCVAMHPDTEVRFKPDEIGKSVFFNISAFGTPVKTTILMGGLEYETYTKILKDLHSTDELPEFNRTLYQRVIDQRRHFVIPSILPGAGQFPDSRARVMDGGREYPIEGIKSGELVPPLLQDLPAAYATLNLSIAIQSKIALERVGLKPGMALYTEGGFRHNRDYNVLLASFFPENPVYLTGIEEATAFGAAITGLASLEGKDPVAYADRFEIETFEVKPEDLSGLDEYEAAFRALT